MTISHPRFLLKVNTRATIMTGRAMLDAATMGHPHRDTISPHREHALTQHNPTPARWRAYTKYKRAPIH